MKGPQNFNFAAAAHDGQGAIYYVPEIVYGSSIMS